MSAIIRTLVSVFALSACGDTEASNGVEVGHAQPQDARPPQDAQLQDAQPCALGDSDRNPCGGCGEIKTVARNPNVALSAPRPESTVNSQSPMILGDDCWFHAREPETLGPPVWGKLKCLTPQQFYCFFALESCSDGKDNDQDGLVDECEGDASVDAKYEGVTPLQ